MKSHCGNKTILRPSYRHNVISHTGKTSLYWIGAQVPMSNDVMWSYFPRASYQIRKIAGCTCTGDAGNVFPATDFQGYRLVSYPGMHHGTCVTYVPWCMTGSLTYGGRENVSGACANRNFKYLARGPWKSWLYPICMITHQWQRVMLHQFDFD